MGGAGGRGRGLGRSGDQQGPAVDVQQQSQQQMLDQLPYRQGGDGIAAQVAPAERRAGARQQQQQQEQRQQRRARPLPHSQQQQAEAAASAAANLAQQRRQQQALEGGGPDDEEEEEEVVSQVQVAAGGAAAEAAGAAMVTALADLTVGQPRSAAAATGLGGAGGGGGNAAAAAADIAGPGEAAPHCLVCCSPMAEVGLGACNHREVCGQCTLRMRLCYDQRDCPLCKTELKEVRPGAGLGGLQTGCRRWATVLDGVDGWQ